jgi:hypothetical protein
MISKYKKISIIYGGSGLECAKKIFRVLDRLHNEEFYPFEPAIIAQKILGGVNIFKTVKEAISSSSLCIIILTYDDIEYTRVRQNVLVEIGMALMAVENTDKCIFLSEKVPLPDDFPSDLRGWINPNYFDKNNLDDVAVEVGEEVKRLLHCKPYKNLLGARNYIYDYENLLADIPNYIFEEKADIQLEHILDCWQDNIASFSFVSERVMYLLERLKFFPDFNSNQKFFDFLAAVKKLIQPSDVDYEIADALYINTACSFASALIDYTDVKLRKETIRCMKNPNENRQLSEEYKNIFSSIVHTLQKFVDKFEKDGSKFNYNWFIKTMAYEYLALAKMKVLNFSETESEADLGTLEYVIDCYKKVIETSEDYGGSSATLWRGYAEYNLTRAYEAMYRITKNSDYISDMRHYSLNSIITRKSWCNVNNFKGVFTSALSYEYFLVKKHELEIRYKIPEYSTSTNEQLIEELVSLDDELKHFCDSTELGRLYDMKMSIDEFRQALKK